MPGRITGSRQLLQRPRFLHQHAAARAVAAAASTTSTPSPAQDLAASIEAGPSSPVRPAASDIRTASPRRNRVLAHLLGSGHDLAGPPDAMTNLRPVYYHPRFVESSPSSSARKLHPYSLDEFTASSDSPAFSTSTSTGNGGQLRHVGDRRGKARALERLEKLRRRFEAEDLEWRLQQRRLDRVAHEYWYRSNSAFAEIKSQAEQRAHYTSLAAASSVAPAPSTATPAARGRARSEDPRVMEEFLRHWVDSRGEHFQRFQGQWLRGLSSHLKPALRAVYRDWRWKLELWRSGVH